MNVILIPPDTRPHTLSLPLQLAKMMNINVLTPPVEALPYFNTPGNIKALHKWIKDTTASIMPLALIASLETLTLGGMIPARRVDDAESEVMDRLSILEELHKTNPKMLIYTHGTIVRVAHGNDPYEEKEYYGKWCSQLQEYSTLADKVARGNTLAKEELNKVIEIIPKEILSNYLDTRKRNTNMHRKAIDYLSSKVISYLALTLDDTSTYGLAAIDRRALESKLDTLGLWDCADIYPGADELPCVLLTRLALTLSEAKTRPKAYFIYNSVLAPVTELLYEDRPLGEVIKAHRRAVGFIEASRIEDADVVIAVNSAGKRQGEAFMQPNFEDVDNASRHLPDFIDHIQNAMQTFKPIVIIDVAYANGCDKRFMQLLLGKCSITRLAGLSGWNTAGNSIGSGLAMAAAALMLKDTGALYEMLYTRLADDWIYQAKVRAEVYSKLGNPSVFHLGSLQEEAEKAVQDLMLPEMKALWTQYFEKNLKVWKLELRKVYLPWPRLFSVAFDLSIMQKE